MKTIRFGFSVSLVGSVQWRCTVSCFHLRLLLSPPFHIVEIFAYHVMVEQSPAIMRVGCVYRIVIPVYYYVDVAPGAILLCGVFVYVFVFSLIIEICCIISLYDVILAL